jgi:GMP synthase (glutamine-hydrolysing)
VASYAKAIAAKVDAIQREVGKEKALVALSGGVDSSVVTLLGHRALGKALTALFVENGLMREGESKRIRAIFARMGIRVAVLDARAEFFAALKGKTDPELKRQAITDTFYAQVFARYARAKKIRHVLQGTILTDIDETVAGIKRQHNVLAQVGIDPVREYGYNVVEPLIDLRKDGVRALARALKLPREITERIPFPGPALAARIIGEVTPERVAKVRAATAIVEEELRTTRAFQYLAVLMADQATGMRGNARLFGDIIVVRCIDSVDARKATATQLPWPRLNRLTKRLTAAMPECARVLYDLTPKPPATVEFI